jgi:hypothetical protein
MGVESRGIKRILLYNQHYYPLFPKGTFPNRYGFPGKKEISREEEKNVLQKGKLHSDPEFRVPSGIKASVIESGGVPKIEENICNIVNEKSDASLYDSKSLSKNLDAIDIGTKLPSKIKPSAKSLYAPKDIASNAYAIPKVVAPNANRGMNADIAGLNSRFQAETRAHASHIDELENDSKTEWLATGLGVAALGVTIGALGGYLLDLLNGRQKTEVKTPPQKRDLCSTDEGIPIRMKW